MVAYSIRTGSTCFNRAPWFLSYCHSMFCLSLGIVSKFASESRKSTESMIYFSLSCKTIPMVCRDIEWGKEDAKYTNDRQALFMLIE